MQIKLKEISVVIDEGFSQKLALSQGGSKGSIGS